MFFVFVLATLGITWWAAGKPGRPSDFFAAGGGISGFKNGLAIAGDYMSAATLLGACALVYGRGYDGLLYVVGFFVGWPILLFLMAERLRNLGKYTFADVISERLDRTKMRSFAALGALTVVFFYLIVQMVGAGELVQLLFGVDYTYSVIVVGVLMMVYVAFGGMIATTWVQIIKAVLLLFGGTVLGHPGVRAIRLQLRDARRQGGRRAQGGIKIMGPGTLLADPDLHLVAVARRRVRPRRAAPHPDALLHRAERQGGAQERVLRERLHRLLLPAHLHARPRRGGHRRHRSAVLRGRKGRRRADRRRQHGGAASRQGGRRRPAARLPRRGRLRDDPRRGRRPRAGGRRGHLARSLRQRVPQGQDDRGVRGARHQDRDAWHRRHRDRARDPVQRAEPGVPRRARVRHRGLGQFPGAGARDVLGRA